MQRRDNQCLAHDVRGLARGRKCRVFVHHAGKEFRVQAAPIDADTHRFAISAGCFNHGRKLIVAFHSATNVSGIDPVLIQHLGAIRILGQQLMSIEMKIADQGHSTSFDLQQIANLGHRCGGCGRIDRDAHEFRACLGKFTNLSSGRFHILRVGIRHRLYDDWRTTSDSNPAYAHQARFVTRGKVFWHGRQACQFSVNRATST